MKQTPIKPRRKVFALWYCRCWNATEAARHAGYQGDDCSLNATASRLLRSVKVRKIIETRLGSLQLKADEILARLAAQATGDMIDFIDVVDGKPALNINKAINRGKTHLISELSYTEHGPKIKLYDAQAALEKLGKVFALFRERNEWTGPNGGPIPLQNVPLDYSRLSVDELKLALAMAEKMQAVQALPAAQEVSAA